MRTNNTISLIISTYNWPEALSLVLQSALQQTRLPDEIIIADDGSTQKTRDIIEQQQINNRIPIKHAWQEDKGFRLAKSRNNALKLAKSNYIIFIDGDTILHPKFVEDHHRIKESNTFVVGSRVLLNSSFSQKILDAQQFNFNFYINSASNKINAIHNNYLANYTAKKRNQPIKELIFKIRGCNLACYRQDIIDINGFNEDFCGWGREDSEFALRLLKKGLWLKHIKFNAIQYHLYHTKNKKAELNLNDEILNQSIDSTTFICKNGLKTLN